jgi:hypothetical protein
MLEVSFVLGNYEPIFLERAKVVIRDLDTYLENTNFFSFGKHVCGKVSTQNKKMSWI